MITLLWTIGCGRCAKATEPANPPPRAAASAPSSAHRTSTTGSMSLGINEGLGVPRKHFDSGRLDRAQFQAVLRDDATRVRDLGATWVRANAHTSPYLNLMDFEKLPDPLYWADAWVEVAQESGLEVILVLAPWPTIQTANHTDRYLPADMDRYKAYVTRVVERYDGDGVDDMPGLTRPVRHFEIDNEPDLHNSTRPIGDLRPRDWDPSGFETPDEYAQVVVATSEAIRKAHPDPFILLAGMYRPHAPQGRAYLQAVLERPGVRGAIDAVAMHSYFHDDSLGQIERGMANVRELAQGLPIWVTETGVPADGRAPHVDQTWQAGMVAAVVGAFLAEGADKVFWHTLADPPPSKGDRSDPGGFFTHSLLQNTLDGRVVDKPAGVVYRNMARVLGPTTTSSYRPITDGAGRALATDRGWLVYWGEVGAPAGATAAMDLRTGSEAPIAGRVRAPAWIPLAP